MADYRIGALWIGGALSYLEQLCLQSFLDAGHEVRLYTYEGVDNAPPGVEQADATAILPNAETLRHSRTGSPALHSDLFRYHMLAKVEHIIWADTDAYCLRKFTTESGHFHAWESETGINGGVLGLPADSATLRALLDFTSDPFAIPDWYGADYRAELEAKARAGSPVHAGDMRWGVWGPHALTHYLQQTGEVRHTMPQVTLYPVPYGERNLMLRPGYDMSGMITPASYSIHFYGRRMRSRILQQENGVPRPKCLIGMLLKKHSIDPNAAPIRPRSVADAPIVDRDGALV